ncbi:hypothetical protein [Azorhizobium caulinodans]|uniref:hypothetical protein n=1 Tax=Azorhizobium caulinodans TaxID=7 RepID=UPI00031D405D|nr:hypothetical protein [Azorhizobium caulinodans]
MRLEVYVLGALVVAASASIFGDLGRAAAPDQSEMTARYDAPVAYSTTARAEDKMPATDTACSRIPGRPAATSLQFLEPGTYVTSDFATGCDAR